MAWPLIAGLASRALPLAEKALPLLKTAAPKVLSAVGAGAVAKKIMGDDEDKSDDKPKEEGHKLDQAQTQPQNPMQPQMAGYPQQMMPGQQQMMAGMVPVGAAGVAGAAVAQGQQPQQAVSVQAQPVQDKPFEGHGDDGFLKSAGKTLLAAGAGALAGFKLKSAEADEKGLEGGARFADLAKGMLAGAGSGAFTKMGYEAIQKDGGGLMAGLSTAAAGSLASTLKEGGPGPFSSFGTGFGAGVLSDFAHDKAERAGHSKVADAMAGTGLGATLGYTGFGDIKSALTGVAGGAGLSTLLGAGAEKGSLLEGIKDMVPGSGFGSDMKGNAPTEPSTDKQFA